MHIDKPVNLSLRDYLIRKTAVRTMINEHTVGEIINYQFKAARAALETNNQVEITGFGKFVFLPKKGAKDIIRLEKMKSFLLEKEPSVINLRKISRIDEELAYLRSKIPDNEYIQTDSRGLAESPDSTERVEGEGDASVINQDGDLQSVSA